MVPWSVGVLQHFWLYIFVGMALVARTNGDYQPKLSKFWLVISFLAMRASQPSLSDNLSVELWRTQLGDHHYNGLRSVWRDTVSSDSHNFHSASASGRPDSRVYYRLLAMSIDKAGAVLFR